ncbi:hypothetical protein LY90DRAFT_389768, partial [Neocallimastix californiae]
MNLKTFNDVSDFPENAPLIMEIIEPNDIKVRRIKFKINKVDNDMCTIDDNIKRDEGEKVLKRGETFNIYVINRTSSKFENEWIPINMEVIDEEYKDDDDDHIDKYFKKSSFSSKENIVPIPAGLSQSGYPYFAPPINIPPFPVGYTEDGIPYYGKKSTIKPIPYAGYCNNGQPFFLPKFCYLPKPSGFTAEGVPYYDIQSFIHQDGYIMSSMDKNIIDEVIKEKEKIKKASSQESENKEKQNKKKKKKKNKKINDYEEFKEFEDENVKTDEEIKKERIENLIKKLIRNNKVIGKQFNNIEELNDELNLLSTPSDLLKYIKSIDLKKKEKSNKIKFAYEPNTLHFQSVNLSVTKTINIKFIADNVSNSKEYKYYINVSPSKIFDTSESVLKVYNNKVYPISITFNPKFLTSEYTEGEISIIDSKGKSYMSCKLSAIKKSFIEVSHETINMGWIFPNKSSEFPLVIENKNIDSNYEDNYNNINEQNDNSSKQNLSENENISQINSNNYLKYEKNPFSISLQLFQLNPLERKVINVHFEPEKLGKYEEQIEIFAPGGDAKVVTIKGKCGIPIGVYPEDSKNSKVRTQDLEYERNEVVKIIVNEDLSDTIDIPDKKNEQIIKSLQMAINDGKYRNILHTIDFGIFINKEMKQRSLTLMNFTNDEIKIGLFTTSHILFFDDFITIPKQSAKVVDINVNFGYYHNKESFKGIINEKIELLCSGINNICINVKGYVGQPLLIPTWELCFFTPCTINTKSSLNMSLINYCQYDLSIIIKFPRESDELNYITSSISDDSSDPTLVKAFSTIPISFIYNAEERGLTLKHVLIKIIKPFKKEISCGLTEKGIYLIGTCLFPYKKKLIPNSDYNSLEFISSWLSHPRRILSEFPSISEMKKMFLRITNDNDDIDYNQLIKFQRNYITFYSISEQKIENIKFSIGNNKKAILTNDNEAPIDVNIINTPCFNTNILSRKLEENEEFILDYYFYPPNKIPKYSTIYGFSLAIEDETNSFSSMQLIGKNEYDFLVFPCPDENKELNIDFGNVESSQEKEKGISRTIMLCNLYDLDYIWNISIIGSKARYSPFTVSLMEGELASNETFPLTFTFNSDGSGTFESSMDLYAKDCTGKLSVKKFIARINLKGTTVYSNISGYPDIIDFGQIVVNTTKKVKFKIENKGNTRININTSINEPFIVSPCKFNIDLDESKEVEVTYNPKNPGCSTKNLIMYANKMKINIPVKGLSGSFELICKKYPDTIDFGCYECNSIVWINCYLTNIGTIPLLLKGITSENENLFKVEYLNVVNTIPNIKESDEKYITKDWWKIVKNNIVKIINNEVILKNQIKSNHLEEDSIEYDDKRYLFQSGASIPVSKVLSKDKSTYENIKEIIPRLEAFSSYHLKIGFINHYKKTISSLSFHYYPIITNDEEDLNLNTNVLKINTISQSYRSIHFSTLNYNFPYVPAKCYEEDLNIQQDFKEYKYESESENNTSKYNLIVTNLDVEVQNLTLIEISNEFKIEDKKWTLRPGEQLSIPIRFEPLNEQTFYKGKAVFKHNHGSSTVLLSGTGASANIFCDNLLDFETAKVNTNIIKHFKMHNRGLIGCRYTLQIYYHQQISPFTFKDSDDPFDIEGYIESGEKKAIPINCYCTNEISSSILHLKYQRVPNGVWETENIELKVEIGQPNFEIDRKELNFETTYVNIPKTIPITIYNSGNANCHWNICNHNPDLIFETSEGVIEPDEFFDIEVSFNPKSYNPLNDTIRFETDCGEKYLFATGIIGIPYLKIESSDINKNFGIAEIEKYTSKTITIYNTGSKSLKYLVTVTNQKINGIDFEKNEYDIFFFKQPKGILKANSSTQLDVLCFPIEYDSKITADYTISSNNGEKCFGSLSCIGGKAKIEIAALNNKNFKLKINEISHKSFNKNKLSLALISHVKLIKSIIDDIIKIKSEIKEEEENFMKEQMKNPMKKHQYQLMKSKKDKNFKMKKSLKLKSNNKNKYEISDNNSTNLSQQTLYQTEEEFDSDSELLEVEKLNNKISIPENLLEIYVKSGQIPNIYDDSDQMNDYIMLHKMNYKNKNEIPNNEDVRTFFEYINSNLEIVTRECVSKIKELGSNKWIKSIDVLVNDMNIIQKSSFIIKEIMNPLKLCDDSKINTYSLGLIKGSTQLKDIALFKMTNNGNMDFNFSITENLTNSIKPLDYDSRSQPFNISPATSVLEKDKTLDVKLSFKSSIAGKYEQQFDIYSDNKVIASFYVNISVGNPSFSIYPGSVDFGIVQINTLST